MRYGVERLYPRSAVSGGNAAGHDCININTRGLLHGDKVICIMLAGLAPRLSSFLHDDPPDGTGDIVLVTGPLLTRGGDSEGGTTHLEARLFSEVKFW